MTSNYNIIYLEKFDCVEKYLDGELFFAPINSPSNILNFNGLEIKGTTFRYGLKCLHFDFEEWESNKTTKT